MIKIKKDPSGSTYEYKFLSQEEEVMQGDGLTKEEILEFIKNLLDSILERNETRVTIEVEDEELRKNLIYESRIKKFVEDEKLTFYQFDSDIGEVRDYVQ